MKSKAIASLFTLSFLGCSAPVEETQSQLSIFNGTPTGSRWESTGALLVGGDSICTVTLIHPKVAITATHCIEDLTENDLDFVEVTFSNDSQVISQNGKSRATKVESFGVRDPNYTDNYQLHFDVAYLVLEEERSDIEIIPVLADPEEKKELLAPGKSSTLVGYGVRENDESGVRYETEVEIESLTKTELNVISDEGKGSCFGDSGGPAFGQLSNGEWRVYGVTSRGAECGVDGVYGLIHHSVCDFERKTGYQLTDNPDYCADAEATLIQNKTEWLERCEFPANLQEQLSFQTLKESFGFSDCNALLTAVSDPNAPTEISEVSLAGLGLSASPPFNALFDLPTLSLENNRLQSLAWGLLEEDDLEENEDPADTTRKAPKLTNLLLSFNELSDLSSVTNFTELVELRAANNQIESLPSFSGLTKLKTLDLASNQLTSIPSDMNTDIENLFLGRNQIKDLTGIGGLINLKKIDLSHNPLEDFSELNNLTSLNDVKLNGANLSAIPRFSNPESLSRFSFIGNNVTDASNLSRLTNANEIYGYYNKISGTLDLSRSYQLLILDLDFNQIEEVLFPPEPNPNRGLWMAYLSQNRIRRIENLPTSMERLSLDGNRLKDLSFLNASHSELRELYLHDNPELRNISSLSQLPELNALTLPYIPGVIDWDNRTVKILEAKGVNITLLASISAQNIFDDMIATTPDLLNSPITTQEFAFLFGFTPSAQTIYMGFLRQTQFLKDLIETMADCETENLCRMKSRADISDDTIHLSYVGSE
ncbi:MAG: leucine-rich repeat domain-containing protein [Pseudobacteriovorax sp.]|nr:leucine-rich repeat domain-containing protein [Pseudobacteriovorax sp.]